MVNILVGSNDKRRFLEALREWHQGLPKEGIVEVRVLPPEGPPVGDMIPFFGVPVPFLDYLKARTIRFEVN